jgi:hypothetical protein
VDPFALQVEDAILFFRRLQPRGMIADDVGLGKTITAWLIARELLERGRIESILVVCPRSQVDQWREELESKFGLNVQAAFGTTFAKPEEVTLLDYFVSHCPKSDGSDSRARSICSFSTNLMRSGTSLARKNRLKSLSNLRNCCGMTPVITSFPFFLLPPGHS